MKCIEIYEWRDGKPRPGKHDCIDILAVPPDGMLPAKGDMVLLVHDISKSLVPTRYEVIEREFLWGRAPSSDGQTPAEWSKVWLHVRLAPDQD